MNDESQSTYNLKWALYCWLSFTQGTQVRSGVYELPNQLDIHFTYKCISWHEDVPKMIDSTAIFTNRLWMMLARSRHWPVSTTRDCTCQTCFQTGNTLGVQTRSSTWKKCARGLKCLFYSTSTMADKVAYISIMILSVIYAFGKLTIPLMEWKGNSRTAVHVWKQVLYGHWSCKAHYDLKTFNGMLNHFQPIKCSHII